MPNEHANVPVVLGELGREGGDEARVVRWLREDGALVVSGEPLVELEVDKAGLEVPAPCAGFLVVYAAEGDVVRSGQELARVGPSSEPSDVERAVKRVLATQRARHDEFVSRQFRERIGIGIAVGLPILFTGVAGWGPLGSAFFAALLLGVGAGAALEHPALRRRVGVGRVVLVGGAATMAVGIGLGGGHQSAVPLVLGALLFLIVSTASLAWLQRVAPGQDGERGSRQPRTD